MASTAQPWIYAFGPSNLLASNSLSADLVQHRAYGICHGPTDSEDLAD